MYDRLIAAEVLRRPMQTSVTIDNLDFEQFEVEEYVHVCVMLKDFKSIVTHAETLQTCITAHYSNPGRPLQFSYAKGGMQCEFTLMTSEDRRGTNAPVRSRQAPVSSTPHPFRAQTKNSSRHKDTLQFRVGSKSAEMPPPSQPASRSIPTNVPRRQSAQRPSPPPPKASLDPETLFLQQYDDEDRHWGERTLNEDEETVGWSASAVNVCLP